MFTNFVSVIKPNEVMLYNEIITVCSEIHTKHTNSLFGQNIKCLMVNFCCIKQPLSLSRSRTLIPQYLRMCELKTLPNFIKLVQMVQHC